MACNLFLIATTTFLALTWLPQNYGMPSSGPGKGKTETYACKVQGQVAMPSNCHKYFLCIRPGNFATVKKCPGDFLFDHQLRMCTKMTKAECESKMCQTTDDKFPDPYSKSNYLTCRNYITEVKECPKGNIYDADKKDCVERAADEETAPGKGTWTVQVRKSKHENEEKPEVFDGEGGAAKNDNGDEDDGNYDD